MNWESLVASKSALALPWLGGRSVSDGPRVWKVKARLPPEYGWYSFEVAGGRAAVLKDETSVEPNANLLARLPAVRGYLVGDRLIRDSARVDSNPDHLIDQTVPVFLVERGLGRFARAVVAELHGQLVYSTQEFPLGPEPDVEAAYQDRKASTDGISSVTPALDLAFRWVSRQREIYETRQRELEAQRVEEQRAVVEAARREAALRDAGTGVGRRALAACDFNAAARAALAISGAEFLDARPGYSRDEMVVIYRFRNRRLECSVHRLTLQIIDSGICLTDHHGEKGDTRFTLESLPGVVNLAIDTDKLVVYRHGDDHDDRHRDWDDDD